MEAVNDITYVYDGYRPDGLMTVYAYYNGSPVAELAAKPDYRSGTARIWPVKKLRAGSYNISLKTIPLINIRCLN